MDYINHLSKDRKLARLLKGQEPLVIKKRKNICLRLCASIMSQQLSTKVAKVIYDRFLELYDNAEPSPEQIAATPPETLRSIGLSNSKVQYILNVAQFALENDLSDKRMRKLSNEEIIELLTEIKGVGKWTVEMLLMFTMAREDVFAVDDYGIQVAMKNIYGLNDLDKRSLREKMISISQKWSPCRTYACLHLWKHKDQK
jgi:DNA-3-methyladenine glycosylase II